MTMESKARLEGNYIHWERQADESMTGIPQLAEKPSVLATPA